MSYKLPQNYKGKKSRRGVAVFFCILLLISSGVFAVWNLDTIVNMFRGSAHQWAQPQQQENEPPAAAPEPPKTQPEPAVSTTTLKRTVGVYLPPSQAGSPQSVLNFAAQAKNKGANALIIDVKDTEGKVLFKTPLGYSFMPEVTAEGAFDLAETADLLKQEGFYLTARISCFYDNLAPRRNPAMAIQTKGVVWLDWDYKSWLNPYSQLTEEYLGDLAEYFYSIGFDEILLYNVEFPVRGKTDLIDYKVADSTADKQTALVNFISYMKERVSGGASIALQVSTALLTEGPRELSGVDIKRMITQADVFVPQLYPSALQAKTKIGDIMIQNPQNEAGPTVNALCGLCESLLQNSPAQTKIRPILQGFGAITEGKATGVCADTVMEAQIAALAEHQITQYDIYQPEGLYQRIIQ